MTSSSSANPSAIPLDQETLSRFNVAKVHNDNTQSINSLDFDLAGELCVTASDDESIHLYSVETGSLKKTIYSKRYGCARIRFTHHSNAVLCASKNDSWDDTIRYLSLYDNKYLRYFKGHRDAVSALEISPSSDAFISASLDRTVRFWDLRTPTCQGLMRLPSQSTLGATVSYDPEGLVFAVAVDKVVRLFDSRSFDKGPFGTFTVVPPHITPPPSINVAELDVIGCKFSPDGQNLLISTNQSLLLLVNSFKGQQVQSFTGHINLQRSVLEAGFSPDAQFVLSGSEDGSIRVWKAATGQECSPLRAHVQPVRMVRWNPTKMMIASACSQLMFWIPSDTQAAPVESETSSGDASRKLAEMEDQVDQEEQEIENQTSQPQDTEEAEEDEDLSTSKFSRLIKANAL